jgi:chemotaxis response regulator CheB
VAGIRTVVVTISPLLADLIHRLAEGHIRLEIVAVLESRDALLERLQSLAPGLILLGLYPGEDDAFAEMVADLVNGARVLALEPDASRVSLHETGKVARAFVDPSPSELITALAEGLDPQAKRI